MNGITRSGETCCACRPPDQITLHGVPRSDRLLLIGSTFSEKISSVTHASLRLVAMSQTVSFKNIDPVPSSGTDFIDIVLSRTQRRLPTVVRPGFKISRIRAFYARKVKFTQESFTEKLDAILTQFPRLDAIHPFHADLVRSASGAG
jgi:NOG1 N-terminal helical domain